MPHKQKGRKKLLPYETIVAASAGDPDAMSEVLKHFDGFISSLATRTLYDANNVSYRAVDHELKERMQLKLIANIILKFDPTPK